MFHNHFIDSMSIKVFQQLEKKKTKIQGNKIQWEVNYKTNLKWTKPNSAYLQKKKFKKPIQKITQMNQYEINFSSTVFYCVRLDHMNHSANDHFIRRPYPLLPRPSGKCPDLIKFDRTLKTRTRTSETRFSFIGYTQLE